MITVLFFQAVVGLMIGFYLTDKKRGVSFKEIKFGIIFLMVFSSVLIFTGSEVNMETVSVTAMSGLILFGGIFTGERIHIKLLESVLDGIQKENVHETVRKFVNTAKDVASMNGNGKEFMDAELYKTVNYLNSLAERAYCLKERELAQQLNTMIDSCVTLGRLSRQISCGDDAAYRQYQKLADSLLAISWDTLSHTERNIQNSLGKNWHLIAFAMKMSHMK